MVKTKFSVTFRIIIFQLLLAFSFSCSNSQWGHHFTFTNNSNYEIDSLQITIGCFKNSVLKNKGELEANIKVPPNGYPHKVDITLFVENRLYLLKTDSFNCYKCDGSHEYIFTEDSAKYRFHN